LSKPFGNIDVSSHAVPVDRAAAFVADMEVAADVGDVDAARAFVADVHVVFDVVDVRLATAVVRDLDAAGAVHVDVAGAVADVNVAGDVVDLHVARAVMHRDVAEDVTDSDVTAAVGEIDGRDGVDGEIAGAVFDAQRDVVRNGDVEVEFGAAEDAAVVRRLRFDAQFGAAARQRQFRIGQHVAAGGAGGAVCADFARSAAAIDVEIACAPDDDDAADARRRRRNVAFFGEGTVAEDIGRGGGGGKEEGERGERAHGATYDDSRSGFPGSAGVPPAGTWRILLDRGRDARV